MDKSEESDSDTSERQEDSYVDLDEMLRETVYIEQTDEELGEVCGMLPNTNLTNCKKQEKCFKHFIC